MKVEITLLGHSGFLVRTGKHTLIFDYWDRPGEAGQIDPGTLAGEDVIVFVSHGHHDHYSPVVLEWRGMIPGIRYVFSSDISARDVLSVAPGQRLVQPDFTVSTLDSTDEGVAFLLEIDGISLYHAGDLNWWYWDDEPEEENRALVDKYRQQVDLLPAAIDLAFIPVDPRLEAYYAEGIDYLMRDRHVRWAVPMHLWDSVDVVDRLKADPRSLDYRDRVLPLIRREQKIEIEL